MINRLQANILLRYYQHTSVPTRSLLILAASADFTSSDAAAFFSSSSNMNSNLAPNVTIASQSRINFHC